MARKKVVEGEAVDQVEGEATQAIDPLSTEAVLAKLRADCEKNYGTNILVKLGDESTFKKVDFLPLDIPGVDDALGGGLGCSRIAEIYGPESSGKTTLALHAIASGQKRGICAFVDAEHAFDPVYAANLGVNIKDLWFSQPDSGEQALDFIEDLVDSGKFAVIVVDSVAALTPQAEIDGEMGDAHVGLQARLMSQALRKLTAKLGKTKTILIFINQIRMKIGIMFGNPETTCVHPDTMVDVIRNLVSVESMTMENLFKKVNLDYQSMEKNIPYDVSDKNVKVRSFNHESGKNEFARILSLIRKDDIEEYNLVLKNGDILLRCSGEHRIYDKEKDDYLYVKDIEEGVALDSNNNKIPFFVVKTGKIIPIVDMNVEGNENYFTNGLLSHNTGGNALKFYASQRIEVRKKETNSDADGEAISNDVKIKIVKNKLAPPFRIAEERIVFGKGIDRAYSLLKMAVALNVVDKKGAWYYYNDEKIGQGEKNTLTFLEDNEILYEEIAEKVKQLKKV